MVNRACLSQNLGHAWSHLCASLLNCLNCGCTVFRQCSLLQSIPEWRSPDIHDRSYWALTYSCSRCMRVLTALTHCLISLFWLLVRALSRKRRSSRGHQSLSGLLSRPNGSEDSASPCSPADHTYEKLKTVIYSTRQAANRPPQIITNAAVAAPPLPSSPRPVHILSNPGGSVRPPSGNYARLFAQ